MYQDALTTDDGDVVGIRYNDDTDTITMIYLTGPRGDEGEEFTFPAADALRIATCIEHVYDDLGHDDEDDR